MAETQRIGEMAPVEWDPQHDFNVEVPSPGDGVDGAGAEQLEEQLPAVTRNCDTSRCVMYVSTNNDRRGACRQHSADVICLRRTAL